MTIRCERHEREAVGGGVRCVRCISDDLDRLVSTWLIRLDPIVTEGDRRLAKVIPINRKRVAAVGSAP